MTRTLTLESQEGTVDTKETLSTQGSVTTPDRQVPPGVTRIARIEGGVAPDLAAAGSAVFFLRLAGAALVHAEQVIVLAAAGGATVQSGADPVGLACQFSFDVDIAVKPNVTLTPSFEMAGSDLGDCSFTISLIYA